MIEFNMKAFLADQRKKEKYVCDRIPNEGMRIVLAEGTSEYPPLYADLSLVRWEGLCDLVIETNEPDLVDLNEVYKFFRHRDMTLEERWREMLFVAPVKDYARKIGLLSKKERRLFEASSEYRWQHGEFIAATTGYFLDGNTKECLRLLTMLGLLQSSRRGYIRRRPPTGPYATQ
jgi:hypothetical protein